MYFIKTSLYFLLQLLIPLSVFAQVIKKPVGCFAGTNGLNSDVLAHPEARGVLLVEKWSDIETTDGVYNFDNLNEKIDLVKSAGLKYSLAISGGAFGSPDWLIDNYDVAYHNFEYQNQSRKLPLWWDPICKQKLMSLIEQLGNEYADDEMLSHIYITQMTVNGIEGHLNGVDMKQFASDGFTNQKWIDAAKSTVYAFADAFPDKPLVFEIHEIDRDTIVPATIINELTQDQNLCNRVGLGMWWLSGKNTYQTDLLKYIESFSGDKYAQVIGRSDQSERFANNDYSSIFSQAKQLNIRYLEPWPYEFQHHTHDSLIQDFNTWADSRFSALDTCSQSSVLLSDTFTNLSLFPNPTDGKISIDLSIPYQNIEYKIYNAAGQLIDTKTYKNISQINYTLKGAAGYYLIEISNSDSNKAVLKVLKK
jgi:hypothetical protein